MHVYEAGYVIMVNIYARVAVFGSEEFSQPGSKRNYISSDACFKTLRQLGSEEFSQPGSKRNYISSDACFKTLRLNQESVVFCLINVKLLPLPSSLQV